MSASRMPTLRPSAESPRARLTAVVDLPTPPLPEATAMIASTPGTPAASSPRARAWGAAPAPPAAGAGRAAAGLRSAVSATMADATPGSPRTASSARVRTGSQALTSAASTVIEKKTLPSVATTSDSFPLLGSGAPSGLFTASRLARTASLVTAIVSSPTGGITATIGCARGGSTPASERLTPLPRRRNHSPPYRNSTSRRQCAREAVMARVAFIGLGVMGYPMAGHLKAKGGHDVTVFNRTAAKAEKWVAQHGGESAPTPKQAAEGQDFVMCCVGNDNDLREVTLGANGAFAGMAKGAIFVDHTTASAEIARELHAEGKKRGFDAIDAPVSGGQAGAENGVLTVMCGGEAAPYAHAEPVIAAYARMCKLLGGPGSGQLTKMVNQICIAGLVQGLAEGIHFAKKAGLDVEAVIETISKGAAQSWQMENRYKTMNAGKFDFGFAVDWMRKDLSICLAEARRSGAILPVAALVDQFYSEVQKMGGGRWDTSSLLARLER